MDDQPKLHLLLELIMLLSNGLKYRLEQICDRFDLTERTAQRYIKTIRDAGFIIPRPRNGFYYIDKQSPYFKELSELVHFSREEAQILYNAIHAVSNENIIKQKLTQKLYALYQSPPVANIIVNMQHSNNIHLLVKAVENQQRVVLNGYHSANSNSKSNRIIEPFKFTTNYVSIWAWDVESQQNKIFKISRISSVERLNTPWSNAAQHEEASSDHFRMSTKARIPVRLRLSLRACELLKEEYPLAEPCITPIGDNEYEYSATVHSMEGVGRFVLGLCGEVEVIEPPKLKKIIKEKAACLFK